MPRFIVVTDNYEFFRKILPAFEGTQFEGVQVRTREDVLKEVEKSAHIVLIDVRLQPKGQSSIYKEITRGEEAFEIVKLLHKHDEKIPIVVFINKYMYHVNSGPGYYDAGAALVLLEPRIHLKQRIDYLRARIAEHVPEYELG